MKRKYRHLTQKERDRLEALLLGGHKQKDAAKVLKVDESTISREINGKIPDMKNWTSERISAILTLHGKSPMKSMKSCSKTIYSSEIKNL